MGHPHGSQVGTSSRGDLETRSRSVANAGNPSASASLLASHLPQVLASLSYPSSCFAILTGVLSFVVLCYPYRRPILRCACAAVHRIVVLSYPILRCAILSFRRRILRCACSASHRVCCALLSLQASYPSLCHPSLCHPIITGLIAPTLFRCHRLHVVVASATSTRARPIVRTAWVWTTLWTRGIGTCP